VLEAALELCWRHWVSFEESLEEGYVGEVRRQGAVAGEDELFGVVLAEAAVGDLTLEETHRPLHHGPDGDTELHRHTTAAIERLTAHEAHKLRALGKEMEARRQHAVDLLPAVAGKVGGLVDADEPVRERRFQHLAVEGVLRGEVVQETRAPDADGLGDLVQRSAVVAVLGEALRGGAQDGFPGGTRRIHEDCGVRHFSDPIRGIAPTDRTVGGFATVAVVPKVLLALLIGFAVSQIALLCTTIYLHRALSHKALTVSATAGMAFRVVLWLTTGIRPRQWVAVHRRHHAFTDVAGDPHSPVLLGFWQVQLGNVFLYRKAIRQGEPTMKYAKDLPPDRLDRALFDHAFVGLGIGIAILCLAFGWEVGLMAAGFHTVIYLSLNAAVNAVGHSYGRRIYDNNARNAQWLAWLAAGEGLHNNHHAAPTSAKLALHRGEIDPAWWLIHLMERLGQAKIRLRGVHLVNAALGEPEPQLASG